MTEPTIGTWQRVTTGPQRGQSGVVDFIRDFPTGRYYRITNPETKQVIGRFRAEQLEPTSAPQHESKVPAEARQRAFDLLTKGLPS
jgi:hypothetical protein